MRNDEYLPTYDELKAPEIQMTAAPLRAAAKHLGKYCDQQYKEFMLCKSEEDDPRKCLKENKDVAYCSLEFFQKMKQACPNEFTDFHQCIDYGSYKMDMTKCKKTMGVFDSCMKEKMGMEKPPEGYFCKIRVHDSQRPRPRRYIIPLPDESQRPMERLVITDKNNPKEDMYGP